MRVFVSLVLCAMGIGGGWVAIIFARFLKANGDAATAPRAVSQGAARLWAAGFVCGAVGFFCSGLTVALYGTGRSGTEVQIPVQGPFVAQLLSTGGIVAILAGFGLFFAALMISSQARRQ